MMVGPENKRIDTGAWFGGFCHERGHRPLTHILRSHGPRNKNRKKMFCLLFMIFQIFSLRPRSTVHCIYVFSFPETLVQTLVKNLVKTLVPKKWSQPAVAPFISLSI